MQQLGERWRALSKDEQSRYDSSEAVGDEVGPRGMGGGELSLPWPHAADPIYPLSQEALADVPSQVAALSGGWKALVGDDDFYPKKSVDDKAACHFVYVLHH